MQRGTTEKSESNLLILSVFGENYQQIQEIIKQHENIVVCLFNNESFIDLDIDFSHVKAIVQTPYSDSLTKDYVGQFIFGAFGRNETNLRFKYTIPAELGLDSVFIYQKIDSIVNFAIQIGELPVVRFLQR